MTPRFRAACLMALTLAAAAPASAQVVHGLQFGGGFFEPRGFDARADHDVLVRDLSGQPMPADPSLTDALLFDIKGFRTGHVFGEWTIGFGPHLEAGFGVGFLQRSVPSVYADVVLSPDNTEIPQTLHLRVVPLTAVVRFLPFGRPGEVQPYIGAGVAALAFHYSESGQFVDPQTLEVYDDHYTASGTAPGGVVLGGVRFPIRGDIYAFSVEGRYQFGTGNTGGINKGFLDEKIDLGGWLWDAGFLIRF
jgi:hypothetical protein